MADEVVPVRALTRAERDAEGFKNAIVISDSDDDDGVLSLIHDVVVNLIKMLVRRRWRAVDFGPYERPWERQSARVAANSAALRKRPSQCAELN